ncbi:AAA family ATPase [Candidatus Micrarchaeota archaeon]|nr:AAA family ATPase [Candidatus Micrarchaeota archaeon]
MELTDLKLDEKKREIANYEGNTFVVGNPGTGKTMLIVGKVLALLKKGTKPEEILCMTFTNKATEELRTRLIDKLGKEYPKVSEVKVETFHSFGLENIKEYLDQKGQSKKILKESMSRFLLYKCIKRLEIFDYSDAYLVKIAGVLSGRLAYLKSFSEQEAPDAEEILENILKFTDEKKLKPQKEKIVAFLPHIPRILEEYENEKSKYGIDYTDMLLHFREYLEKHPMHFEQVIVDELQDSNELQADIILKLSEKGTRFVVGDRKQSIFRFQGASISTFNRFEENAKHFSLVKNYRSTDQILQYAKTYLMGKTGEYREDLEELGSEREGDLPVIARTAETGAAVIHLINNSLSHSSEVAVIARKNQQLMDVAEALDAVGEEYSITGSNDATSEYIKESVLSLFDVLLKKDMNALIRVLASPFVNLSFNEVIEVKDYIAENNISSIEELRSFPSLKHFFELYDSFNSSSGMYKSFGVLFNTYLLPCAITLGKEQFLTVNSIYSAVSEFFEESIIEDYSDISEYVRIASEVFEMIIGKEESRIQLFTVHSAKGKEFDTVIYLPSKVSGGKISFVDWAFEGIILQKYNILDDLVNEEYKLDFVAMTRAKKELIVLDSKSKYYVEGVSSLLPDSELKGLETIDIEGTSALFNRYSQIMPLLESCKYSAAISAIKELEMERPFSLSWLLDYITERRRETRSYSFSKIKPFLDCPRKYLFEQILGLRPFEESSGAREFGSAVHKALEAHVNGKLPDVSVLEPEVQIAVENAYKCEDKLLKGKPFNVVGVEKFYEIPLKSLIGKECQGTFRGVLDKVISSEGKHYVIDYKTSKSKNDIPLQLHLYRYMYSTVSEVPPEDVSPVFYYVYLLENPIVGSERTFDIKKVRDSQYAEKLDEFRKNLDKIVFGEPMCFLEKGEKCDYCPFEILCERLDHELGGKD